MTTSLAQSVWLCCLHPHIEIGASYPFSLHQRSPPAPTWVAFLTIKHTQYLSQIRSSKHSPLFLGESFWLFQSHGFTPREDKVGAHKCDFFPPKPLACYMFTLFMGLNCLSWMPWERREWMPHLGARKNVFQSTFAATLCVTWMVLKCQKGSFFLL